MPGASNELRLLASALALTIFMLHGHTTRRGTFSPHVKRLVAFQGSQDLATLESEQGKVLTRILEAAEKANAPAGDSEAFCPEWDPHQTPSPAMWEQLRDLLREEY